MTWYLLDHPNPNGDFFYPRRLPCRHGLAADALPHIGVIHTAENLPDFDGADSGAEAVARYAATTSRKVSWHWTVDSDSTVPMLPVEYTGWHVRGFNRCSVGIEIATRHDRWASAPAEWVRGVLGRLERLRINLKLDWRIPPVKLVGPDPGPLRGWASHQQLDPTRRRDPGPNFPWTQFLGAADGADEAGCQTLRRGSRGPAVQALQRALVGYLGVGALPRYGPDGSFGAETGRAVLEAQARLGLDETGVADPLFVAVLALVEGGR